MLVVMWHGRIWALMQQARDSRSLPPAFGGDGRERE